MKIVAIDISGKVDKYDHALYKSIKESLSTNDQLAFACPSFCIQKDLPTIPLCNLTPKKYKQSKYLWKRILKVIEGIINYYIVGKYIRRENIDVLHLQWLPFMEICNIEKYWLQRIRRKNPQLKIILTIHNIFPHNCSISRKETYRRRMLSINHLIDHYIVHTKDTSNTTSDFFGISSQNIAIIHHGIFAPKISTTKRNKHTDTRILLFGLQSMYKGTDILIQATELLPKSLRQHIQIRIVGYTDRTLYNSYMQRAEEQHIYWKNQYVSDNELYQEILDSDILVFPYREISQSGALLLGLYFQKPIIASDLPAFTETLGDEYPRRLFFRNGHAEDLASAIEWYISNPTQTKNLQSIIQNIIKNNSWESAARKTIHLYQNIYG